MAKIIAVTIDEHGNLEYVKTDACDVLLELGETVTRRASHVEPTTFWTRVVFHILRTLVSDKSTIAAWTRTWRCLWRVNTSPVGGPILTWHDVYGDRCPSYLWEREAAFSDRQNAIDAEVKFLNEFFLTR